MIAARFIHYDASGSLRHTGIEPLAVGDNLARTASFSNPFEAGPTGPTAHVSPLFPMIVALAISVGGDGPLGNYLLRWLTILVFALQLALFPLLAERMGLSRMTGFFAALIYLMGDFATANWDANYVGLLIVWLTILSLDNSESSLRTILLLGAIWGALILFTPIVILIFPLWFVWMHRCRRVRWTSLAVIAGLAALVLLPWVIRNYARFHQVVLVRDNLGLELATSNNQCAQFTFVRNVASGCYAEHHPNVNPQEAQLVQSLGEVEYNRERLNEAKTWIETHPARYLGLSLRRAGAFWFAMGNGSQVLTAAATLFSIVGLVVIWRRSRCVATYLLIWLAVFPVSFYFIVAFEERHRIPILWATFLPATEAVLALMGADFSRPSSLQ